MYDLGGFKFANKSIKVKAKRCMSRSCINILGSLTGESEPVRKSKASQGMKTEGSLFELENIIFMGTSAISGSGLVLVLRTGDGELILDTLTAIADVVGRCICGHYHETT